ncbi:hypothetical protein HS088_TW19G00761 [Tripterygium wilfordii]|uniref:Uncharacterized protein n=1 Tax=Tripterygium wilfordii TaxID=458696 RepID=A0A7J7CBP6_TRIWF|nr:uncharacterized protein LOC119985262 [Tripterygium wilfordii]KAF5731156.1 hypothetical protein HS088_TW19G00761 [Tripterygium wilfordii]
MASQVGSVIQDQNLNTHYNGASAGGKTTISKGVKKGGLGGRKPLGDLSNSVKPFLNPASKKQNSNIFSFTEEETGVSKITFEASNKKSISKAGDKVQTGGRRKVLSDISNSGKPSLNEASKKNQGTKLNVVVAEDKIHPSAIAEEGFLHDHNECIKAQTRAMDMDEFLKILGLNNDLVLSKQLETPLATPHLSNLKIGSPTRQMELDEMDEPIAETDISWKHESLSDLNSPTCQTPRSPNAHMNWTENKSINFKLIDSP